MASLHDLLNSILNLFRKFLGMSTANPNAIALQIPGIDIDRVIFSNTVNTEVTNAVGTYTYSLSGSDAGGYPVGIYSFDGGVTYNDFLPASIPGGSLLTHSNSSIRPKVFITPQNHPITDNGLFGLLTAIIKVQATVGTDATIPLIISYVLLALPGTTTVDLEPNTSSTAKLAYTSSIDGISTNYRQILTEGSQTSSGTPTITTVPHTVGAIPNPSFWFLDNDFHQGMSVVSNFWDARQKPVGSSNGALAGVAMDASNFYISPFNAFPNGQFKYRTYKENN